MRWRRWPPCLGGNQPAIIDAANEQFFLRADRFAREFGLAAIIHGSGREYRRLDEIRSHRPGGDRAGQFPAAAERGDGRGFARRLAGSS